MDQKRFDRLTRSLATAPTPVSPGEPIAPSRPMARLDQLVMSHVGDEVLIYDETTHVIHRLNPTSHLIWSLCDGTRTISAIDQAASAAVGAEVSDEVVQLALGQLAAADLLVGATHAEIGEPRHSRRSVLRRLAVAGGVALPVLVSVSAPVAADSHSCILFGADCTPDGTPCCQNSPGLTIICINFVYTQQCAIFNG